MDDVTIVFMVSMVGIVLVGGLGIWYFNRLADRATVDAIADARRPFKAKC